MQPVDVDAMVGVTVRDHDCAELGGIDVTEAAKFSEFFLKALELMVAIIVLLFP